MSLLKREPMKFGLFMGVASAALSGAAFAQAPAQSRSDGSENEIVVTGTFIRGAAESAALPVDVVTVEDLANEGSPTIVELIKTLGVSSGTDGETNQFSSNGLEGLSNINLRGIGPARTLVLLNGRRMVSAPYGIAESAQTFVDTNLIPAAAISRVEVLKDGAAALYGSDAMAGVVNFITNRRLDGLVVSGDYETFEGTDGEYNVSAAYGWRGENTSWVTTLGYNFRSEVNFRERDWALSSFDLNPQGGFSAIGNPGRILNAVPVPGAGPGGTTAAPGTLSLIDPGCTAVGGVVGGGACQFRFIPFDNLVEEEERYQLFSEFNHKFGNGVEFHLEGLYATTDVPEWKTSPSYPPQSPVVAVPATNPGFAALLARNPTFAAANPWLATSPAVLAVIRPFGWSGFPGTGGGAQVGSRSYEAYRLSGGLRGSFDNGVNWDVALTRMEDVGDRVTNDTFTDRFTRAVNGLGGPNCTGTTPGANGCLWYNPFSSSIQQGAFSSAPNPGYVAATANTAELANWLTGASQTEATTRLTVLDVVFDGTANWGFGAGPIGWAVGAQYRIDEYELDPNDNADFTVNPCPVPGVRTCTSQTGVFGFLGPTNPADVDRDVYGVFGELSVPLLENLEAQLALRHEEYGGAVGSTTDPKIAVRWEPSEGLIFRGSLGTTFRGPSLNQLSGQFTTLSFIAPASAFKAVDTFGNPNLRPETALAWNLGVVLDRGGFRGSLDFWSFDIEDPIIVEPNAPIVDAVLAGIASGTPSPLQSRVTFSGTPPSGRNLERVRVNIVNGPNVKTSGLDFAAEYIFDDVWGGSELSFGLDGSYTFEYQVDALVIGGVRIAAAYDGVGFFNRTRPYIRPIPEYRFNAFANYARGAHNLRYVLRYISEYEDERTALFTTNKAGQTIEADLTHDVFYRFATEGGFAFTASVVNVTDEDPPFARFDTSYDPYTHRPFGRTFKIGLSKTFGGG